MKVIDIIRREYLENIRKKSFIVSTILVPVLMMSFLVIPLLSTFFVGDEQISLTVLDRTGEVADDFIESLADTLKDGRPKFVARSAVPSDGDFDRLKSALVGTINEGALDVVVEIPEDAVETGRANYITKDVASLIVQERFESHLEAIVFKKRLESRGLDYEQVKALTQNVRLDLMKTTKEGSLKKGGFLEDYGIVFLFMMVLYVALITWGISVQRSIIEEKGSRVIEVMLSSVEPKDLFIGKILGVGAVGLTQIAIWAVTFFTLAFYGSTAAIGFMENIHVSPAAVIFFVVYFILGFLLYSAIFSIVGAICSTEQDAQQLQGVVTLPLIVPLLLIMMIIQSPNTTVAAVTSQIPLFSPMLMLARIVVMGPSAWEIVLSILLLLVSIYGVILFSARVFRVGILMYGKRPGMREILKWYRRA